MSAIKPNQQVAVVDLPSGVVSRPWSSFFDALTRLPSAKLSGSVTYDPPSISAAASAMQVVTVDGALLGWDASAAFSLDLAGLMQSAYVNAADSVTVVLFNPTAAPINLAAGTLTAYAWKP